MTIHVMEVVLRTAEIFQFPKGSGSAMVPPGMPAEPPALRQLERSNSEIGLAGVAKMLGLAQRPPRAIIATVRLMIDTRGFPMPKTPRFVKGEPKLGSAAVHSESVWNRDQVEIWIDDDRPPPDAAAHGAAKREAVRAGLAARAKAIAA
jgi:hypothetical protein